MSVRIILDNAGGVFTNLDIISGKVVLALSREETFAGVTVKLECESRTRLAAPRQDRRDRYDTELEVHKLLYKTLIVFPSKDLAEATLTNAGRGGANYTLQAGHHEWPFQFKLPFNNSCAPVHSFFDRAEMGRDLNRHVKRALPPSLSGFPGEAEIKYYVKATAQRAAFYKENFRAESSFQFFPIEPIRPPPNRREAFARRQFQFAPHVPGPQKTSLFKKPSTVESGTPPSISIDGRLPDPPILTCHQPIPLRILVKKLNETTEQVYLNSFQLVVIGHTMIRAHDLNRRESTSWVVASKANMNMPLGNASTAVNTDFELDATLWKDVPLLPSICPTFETCNLGRNYELEIRLGLVHGTPNNMKPELTIQTLLMPITIYSGIKPPPELIEKMAAQATDPIQPPAASPISPGGGLPPRKPLPGQSPATEGNGAGPGANQPQNAANEPPPPFPDEPPPSYEDAIADNVAPVGGPRREYEQPASAPVVGDEKRGSLFNRGGQ